MSLANNFVESCSGQCPQSANTDGYLPTMH